MRGPSGIDSGQFGILENFQILITLKKIMIVGKIKENEKTIRINVDISCTNCGKSVPGGIKASEEFSKTKEFQGKIDRLKEDYLCGICRDRKRVGAS